MTSTKSIDKTAGILIVTGRIMLGSLFVLGAINKIINYAATSASMQAVGLEPVAILLPATIILELAGGLWLAACLSRPWFFAAALAVFTLSTNWFFHAFWTLEGAERQLEIALFFKNFAIAGALLLVAGLSFEKSASSQ